MTGPEISADHCTMRHKKSPDKIESQHARLTTTTRLVGSQNLATRESITDMTRYEWLETERGMALGLCASERFPLREITNIINIPKSTVNDINKCGTGVSKPRSGRPIKLSSRDIRQIIRYIRTSKFTRRFSLNKLKMMFGLTVHENTIRNAFVAAGYYHRIARRRPYLNK